MEAATSLLSSSPWGGAAWCAQTPKRGGSKIWWQGLTKKRQTEGMARITSTGTAHDDCTEARSKINYLQQNPLLFIFPPLSQSYLLTISNFMALREGSWGWTKKSCHITFPFTLHKAKGQSFSGAAVALDYWCQLINTHRIWVPSIVWLLQWAYLWPFCLLRGEIC